MLLSTLEQTWTIRHFRDGKIIWEAVDKKNRLVDEGEKAFVDIVYRDKASNYFGATDFWVGLYNGSISESTTLSTIPNEPPELYGYSRLKIERSEVGWPTIDKNDEGNWRVTSKVLTFTATGGDIGPINGYFLCTSSDNTGTLIAAVSLGVERTIISSDFTQVQVKAAQK